MTPISTVEIILNYDKAKDAVKKGEIPDDARVDIIKNLVYGCLLQEEKNKDKFEILLRKLLNSNKKFITPYPNEEITTISAPFILEFEEINREINKRKKKEPQSYIAPTLQSEEEQSVAAELYKEALYVMESYQSPDHIDGVTDDITEYFIQQFRRKHTGDEDVQTWILLIYASMQIDSEEEILQIKSSGPPGAGKTHAIRKALEQCPDEFVYDAEWSPRSLFRSNTIKPGSIILTDDEVPDEHKQAIIKRAISAGHNPSYYDVTVDKEVVRLSIPGDTVFVQTSVEDVKDEAYLDRYNIMNHSKNPENNRSFVKFSKEKRSSIENIKQSNEHSHEIDVCKEIIRVIKMNRYYVIIPFSEYISFSHIDNYRSINSFWGVLASHAVVYQKRRRCEMDADGVHINIYATKEDFDFANRLTPKSINMRDFKLQKLEQSILNLIIGRTIDNPIQQCEIAKEINKQGAKLGSAKLSRILNGNLKERGLTNIPGVEYTEIIERVKIDQYGREYTTTTRGKFWYDNGINTEIIANFATLSPGWDDTSNYNQVITEHTVARVSASETPSATPQIEV